MALMKPKKRQKLCYNCEGEVDLDVIVCPFCAADLRAEKPELHRSAFSASVSSVKQLNAENSLYPPQLKITDPLPIREEVVVNGLSQPLEEAEGEEPSSFKSTLNAVSLFTLGVHFCVLGLALILFSDRGVLILKWNANLWLLYLALSGVLLFFGYRALQKIK